MHWYYFLVAVACLNFSCPGYLVSASTPSGRFIHLSDFHLDLLYATDSRNPNEAKKRHACHIYNDKKAAHIFGLYECDSPLSLINATFENLRHILKKYPVDFIVVTGDYARHSSDVIHPRSLEEVFQVNKIIADKFEHLSQQVSQTAIPVITTLGNNDVHPHNQLPQEPTGKSPFLQGMYKAWAHHIPPEEKQTYLKGGFYMQTIFPNQLYVISLNTMFFYRYNLAVAACRTPHSAGDLHLQWLKEKLAFIRSVGGKVHIMGHVPALSTSYSRSCYTMYVDIVLHFSDIILGHYYGHSNVDSFFFIPDIHYQNEELKENPESSSDPQTMVVGYQFMDEPMEEGDSQGFSRKRRGLSPLYSGKSPSYSSSSAKLRYSPQNPFRIKYNSFLKVEVDPEPRLEGNVMEEFYTTSSDPNTFVSAFKEEDKKVSPYRQPEGELGRRSLILYMLHNYRILTARHEQDFSPNNGESQGQSESQYFAVSSEDTSTPHWNPLIGFIGPSIVPTLNPAFRMYTYSTQKGTAWGALTNYYQFYFPLSKNTLDIEDPDLKGKKSTTMGKFEFHYSAKEKFGMNGLGYRDWLDFAKVLTTSKKDRREWIRTVFIESCEEEAYINHCYKLLKLEDYEL